MALLLGLTKREPKLSLHLWFSQPAPNPKTLCALFLYKNWSQLNRDTGLIRIWKLFMIFYMLWQSLLTIMYATDKDAPLIFVNFFTLFV